MATATETTTWSAPQVNRTQILIGDEWCDSVSGKRFATVNPATEEPICDVAEGDAADIDLAVRVARRAFETGPWPAMDARDRGRLLNRLADLIEENFDELAALETLDNGKPISDARPAGPTRFTATQFPCAETTFATHAASRSACAVRSFRGTFPC